MSLQCISSIGVSQISQGGPVRCPKSDLAVRLRSKTLLSLLSVTIAGSIPCETHDWKAGSAEALVYKKELRAETYESKCLKQRFLRHAQRFQDSLNKRQKRFRLLLEQSVLRALSVDEQTEFEKLQQSRLVPTQAVEQQQIPSIQKDIAEIEDLLRKLGTIPPKNEK